MITSINKLLRKIIDRILGPYLTAETKIQTAQIPAVNRQLQILLALKYKELAEKRSTLPKFADVEFRSFSQNGEDGILHYIFSLVGTTNKKAVEICAGNGQESNTANLIINQGFEALLFDGDEKNIKTASEFYRRSKDTFIFPPKIVHAWITAENINDLIRQHGMSGDIDLLSLDIDGMDYWVLKAVTACRPRVIVLEYHEEFGFEAITVPYEANFRRESKDMRYFGASLPAFVKLLKEKGYRLVGANRQKFNAFFLRDDTGTKIFPEVSIESCMRNSDPKDYGLLQELKNYPFEKI